MKKYIQPDPLLRLGRSKKYNKESEVKVGECLQTFWRPNYDDNTYPYLPPHCTRPKESLKIYQLVLPARCVFAMPDHSNVMYIPLYDLWMNPDKYGTLLRAVPSLISTFALRYYEEVNN